MDDDALWQAFHDRTLGHHEWTHQAHVRVAWMHLARWPALDEAHLRMRIGIVRLDREAPLRHYRRERLFSLEARSIFVAPDLAPLP